VTVPRWLAWLEAIYRGLLRLYPAAFQQRFAGEMAQVFSALGRQAYAQNGPGMALRLGVLSLADGLLAAARQWGSKLFNRRIAMESTRDDNHGGLAPLSTAHAGLAVLPYILYGLACMLAYSWHPTTSTLPPPVWELFLKIPYLWFAVFCLAGLTVGLANGFPRWAQPYLGWTLYFCWWWSNMTTYSYRWDAKVWLAPLGALLLAMILRRSLRPVVEVLRALWQDWTLPSFALFIFYCGVSILFDENHHPILLLFMAAATLAAAAGAWAYYRLAHAVPRVLALGGMLVVLAFLQIWSYGTWDYRAYYNLPPGPKFFDWHTLSITLVVAAVMLVPALADWLRKRRGIQRT